MRELKVPGQVRLVVGAVLVIGAPFFWVACGGKQRGGGDYDASFDCKDRSVKYNAKNHLGGNEIGVEMDCASSGPRIARWRVDKSGTRQDDAHGISPGEFEKIWKEVDGSGWQYLKDCSNGTMGKNDPVYTFDIKDDQAQNTFSCQSQSMPFPYSAIVDPLDLAAQQGQRQLGDDEPAEMKALDKKDKQR
jgi:hypothetical protein